jgi:hypothetical protein
LVIKTVLSKYKMFKEAVARITEINEFKAPKPPVKAKNLPENASMLEEENKSDGTLSLLSKRKKLEGSREEETNKKTVATKENTKDISSFFTSKRPATTSSATFHQTLPKYENHIFSGSADFGTLQNDEWQGTAVGLSSNTLDEFARQTGFKEISPSDSASQVGGESSVLGSSATQGLATEEVTRKREQKAQDKLKSAIAKSSTSNVTRKSFGNALKGQPGATF